MGTIKFEIDLPEFEKELSINLVIRRDGEVICSTSSSPTDDKSINNSLVDECENLKSWNKEVSTVKDLSDFNIPTNDTKLKQTTSSSPKKSRGGNFMNVEI